MPINFLGEPKHPIKKVITRPDVKMHLPEKELKKLEAKKKKAAKIKTVKKTAEPAKTVLGEVNLIKAFKIYLLKKRLTFFGLFAIIILIAGFIAGYFLFFYKPQPKPQVNINQPLPEAFCGDGICNSNELCSSCPADCGTCPLPPPPAEYCGDRICNSNELCSSCPADCGTCPLPPPPAEYCGDGICNSNELCSSCPADCGTCPPPLPLPDTELVSLRGSLVKFQGDNTIYLVENNGELRQINLTNVSFLNGQKISQVSPSLIYQLNDRFKNVRKGKDVVGKVDWDPRILSQLELAPFLK